MPSKILIIDDSELAREAMSAELESHGVEVVTHGSPFGSTALILREQPNLVLLDIEMPGIQGDVLLRLCRDRGLDSDTKFYFWSSMSEADLALRAQEAGALGYFRKGDVSQIARQLVRLLE